MKKAACFLFLAALAFSVCGQTLTLAKAREVLQGTWLSTGDSTNELLITPDSITTFRFRLNGVSRCAYSLSEHPCEKAVKFPSATGIYIVEKYATNIRCCALQAVAPNALKIIYPDGNEVEYKNEAIFLKEVK